MVHNDALASFGLLTRSKPHQAKYSAMRLALHNDEFSEILIKRDENAILVSGNCKDGLVSRVVVPIATPNDVVAEGLKRRFRTAPHARIE
jgi:hypothetical protein